LFIKSRSCLSAAPAAKSRPF